MCRSRWTTPAATAILMLLAISTFAWAESPTTRPAGQAAPPASQPAQVSQIGVVRAALTQLYIVPRNPAPPWPDEVNARNAQKPATRPAQTWPPAITIERQTVAAKSARVQPADKLERKTTDASKGTAQQASGIFIESIPWYRTGPRVSQKEREWADYRYYGGQPSRYGLGSRYAMSDDYDSGVYRYGFMEGYDYGQFIDQADQRVQQLIAHATAQIDRGVKLFQQGQYQQAADIFQLACESNQGDATARVYAGHALFALGRYRDAVRNLRRAFELQPRIAYLIYDVRGDYDEPAKYEQQLNALRKALEMSPRDVDRLFLMGYMHYYTGQRTAAWRYFQRVQEVDKNDAISERLMRNAQPPDVEVDALIQQRKK